MNPFALSGALTGMTSLAVGIFVFSKDINNRLNKLWIFFAASVAVFGFSVVWIGVERNQSNALLAWRAAFSFGVLWIPILFYHFVLIFCELQQNKRLIVHYILGSLFFPLILFSPLFFSGVRFVFSSFYYSIPGSVVFYLFFLWWTTLVIYSHFLVYRKFKQASGLKRNQFKFFLIAFSLAYITGSLDYLPIFGIDFYPYGNFGIILYPLIMMYAIGEYQVMEIRTVIHKTVMWLTTTSLVIVPVGGVFYLSYGWTQHLSPVQLSALVGGIALLMIPYFKMVQPRIDHLFQRRKYDMQKILRGLVYELATLKDLDVLCNKITRVIQEALYVSKTSLVLWNEEDQRFHFMEGEGTEAESLVKSDGEFISWIKNQDRVIEWEEIRLNPKYESIRHAVKNYIDRFDAKVVLPLIHEGSLVGLINLSEKKNLKSFSEMDIDFLSSLRAEASIAVSNSILYDNVTVLSSELREWAHELENKVESRTHELAEKKMELEDSYQKLQELDRMKDRFFANISHELRTPITLILAPTNMMLNRDLGELTPQQEKYIKIMHANAMRLLKLINNLLDLSKVDSGKMKLYYTCCDFAGFMEGVVSSISPLADEKALTLHLKVDEDISNFYFDPDKIEKVVLNLVHNAIKFTESGGIRIDCVNKENHVRVSIADTGVGIPKDQQSQIFTRFSQADNVLNRSSGGTGIGLALSKELIELHQGKVWVESEEGSGAIFLFTLPICQHVEEVPGSLDRRVVLVPGQEKRRVEDWSHIVLKEDISGEDHAFPEDTDPKNIPSKAERCLKILLIDDNADILRYLCAQLERDYKLLFAKDGREGIARAKSEIPDLIISDIMMPYKDGFQLCREVKQDHRTCHIPVILLTARTELSRKMEGLEYGADDYLTKPFSPRELKARVRSLLNLRKLEREIQLRNRELEEAMVELKETQGQLIQSEKMAALGLLVAGVAHEINNPVSFAKGSLTTIQRSIEKIKHLNQIPPDKVKEICKDVCISVDIVKHGLERTENIVRNLKTFVRKDEAFVKETDLLAGLETTLQLCQHEMTYRIQLHRDYGKIALVDAVPGQISQVFMNIIQNAIHAIPDQGDIYIKAKQERDHVIISFRDTGLGIPEKDLERIFEPFFTTKETTKGTGLGLAVSNRIIARHHGKIDVKSKVGSGTEVTIFLPLSQPMADYSIEGKHYAGNVRI